MTEVPPTPEESGDVDDLYRRASAHDAGRPSESVRRAVLDHAAQLAAQRAGQRTGDKQPGRSRTRRPAARQSWWRPAAFGTLAAAALAGLLVTPQFLTRSPPNEAVPVPAAVSRSQAPAAPGPVTTTEGAANGPGAPKALGAPSRPAMAGNLKAQGNFNAQGNLNAQDKLQAQGKLSEEANISEQAKVSEPSGDSEQSDARLASSRSSGAAAMSAAPIAPMVSAGRLEDLGAQLRRAAEIGDVAALHTLLDKQAAIDARDAGGRTALMLATVHGRIEAVDVLLSSGADPNAADAQGTTPLQAALAGGQNAIAAALRRAGAR